MPDDYFNYINTVELMTTLFSTALWV